ncbi:MAG: hypothetical protein FJW37_11170, partial [Acidobacteria bacterium]|nr:hypothetical protein [Acidobacteriota bacterium]
MADFRKLVFALVMTVLLLGMAAGTANAQALSCVASASPTIMRSESVADSAGDILLACSNLPATLAYYTITVQLSTNVTNRILESTNSFVDAVLTVDLATGSIVQGSFGQNRFSLASQLVAAGAIMGRLTSSTTVTFSNVPLGPGLGSVIRITNLRANAALFPSTPVTAFLSTSSPSGAPPLTVTNNVLNIGSPQVGSTSGFRVAAGGGNLASGGFAAFLCEALNADLTTGGSLTLAAASFNVRFSESQVLGFRTLAQEHGPAFNASTDAFDIGEASTGTRLRVVFNNVPSGVQIFVTTGAIATETSSGVTAAFVNNHDTNGSGGVAGAPSGTQGTAAGVTIYRVPVSGGTGVAVWEITGANASTIDTASFGVVVAAAAGQAASGVGVAHSSLAPVSSAVTAGSAAVPVPRFVDTSSSVNFLNVNPCRSNLLFPYLLNQGGYNTGIAIANTSADIFSTAAQSGTCTINYYGDVSSGSVPAAQTTTSPIASGKVIGFTLSSGGVPGIAGAPGFVGYGIVQCNFRYAHGFAFISDVGVA